MRSLQTASCRIRRDRQDCPHLGRSHRRDRQDAPGLPSPSTAWRSRPTANRVCRRAWSAPRELYVSNPPTDEMKDDPRHSRRIRCMAIRPTAAGPPAAKTLALKSGTKAQIPRLHQGQDRLHHGFPFSPTATSATGSGETQARQPRPLNTAIINSLPQGHEFRLRPLLRRATLATGGLIAPSDLGRRPRKEIAILTGHTDFVNSVSLAPMAGRRSASNDGTVKLEPGTGQPAATFKYDASMPSSLRFCLTRDARRHLPDGTIRQPQQARGVPATL